jgi:hypothetical protein
MSFLISFNFFKFNVQWLKGRSNNRYIKRNIIFLIDFKENSKLIIEEMDRRFDWVGLK